MSFLSFFVEWINSLTQNFGWAVVLSVCCAFVITIPFKIWSHKNNEAKKRCQPELARIQKKYHANAMGVSLDDNDPHLSPEIRKMSRDERSEAMANEIEALYKKNGYHIWTGWIPSVLTILMVILLYSGITSATPEGFYMFKFADIKGSFVNNMGNALIFAGVLVSAFVSNIISSLSNIINARNDKNQLKGAFIGAAIILVIQMALMTWISFSVTTSIAIAIITFTVLSMIESGVTTLCTKRQTDFS